MPDRLSPRLALLVTLALAWPNFLLTTKWADLPGALNGWKRPYYAAALLLVTVLTCGARAIGRRVSLPALPVLLGGAWTLLAIGFVRTFPPASWRLIPFFDDWPPRFQATIEGVRLLGRGAVTGWMWGMLGGYQTSADVSQSLSALGAMPIALFGGPLGYHVLHAAILLLLPLLLYRLLVRDMPRDAARLAGILILIAVVGYFGTLMPSGDTNSIAGVLCAIVAMAGSRYAQLGRRWGGPLMLAGLTLALYTHAAFFLYTAAILGFEALYYRDPAILRRALIAGTVAFVAALPLYWELIRYPAFFITNNVIYAPGPIDWNDVAHKIYYNVEIQFFPHRWFNDYNGFVNVWWPVVAWVAWKARHERAGFYAAATLLVSVLLFFDVPELGGYLFSRATHLRAVLTPIPVAWFIIEQAGTQWLAWPLVAATALYVQTGFAPIPHVAQVRGFDPALVDHLGTLDGALVLLEGNPHRDLIADPAERTERTPFGTHFDSMIAAATNRRYYAQTWDGYHWTPLRDQTIAAGSFRGRGIAATPVTTLVDDLHKWGVRHLVVWSQATIAYLTAAPDRFARRWTSGRWQEFELLDADTRAVVVSSGSGTLGDLDPLGATIALDHVRHGDTVVVRTNYFPAWNAHVEGVAVPLRSIEGQLAFTAPRDGTYTVTLTYPRRPALLIGALAALLAGALVLWRMRSAQEPA